MGNGDWYKPLEHVTEQGDRCRLFAADTQHVGGPGVVGALRAWIRQAQ